MKILFVGNVNAATRCCQRLHALLELGHEVTPIPTVSLRATPDEKSSIIDRVLWKVGIPRDEMRANKSLIEAVHKQEYDLVWIEKGNQIWPKTLSRVKAAPQAPVLAGFSEDDMWAGHNRSIYFRRGLRNYDVFFTTKSYNCRPEELPSLGAKRVIFVDKSYDVHLHRPVTVSDSERSAVGSDVGFIGTYEAQRATSLLMLAQAGFAVKVWGSGPWQRLRGRSPNLNVNCRTINGEEYVKALCATKINLCFLRKTNRDLQTDRTMEIPACGAFMLAERTDEHRRLFEEDREAVYFGSIEELLAKTRNYLVNDLARIRIASAGRDRCLREGYSHVETLKKMIREIIELHK